MADDILRTSQAQVDAMFDSDEIPQELVGDVTLDDLRALVEEMVTGELHQFQEAEIPEDETEDAIRVLIERIALKVGLICMNIAPKAAGVELSIDADSVLAVFADLMRSGGATLTLRVN